MTNVQRILIISAHPDDETLGCGGTIAKYRSSGVDVRVIFMAEGISARFDEVEIGSEQVNKLIQKRNDNAIKALDVLSVEEKDIFLNTNSCCRLDTLPQINLVKYIENHINEFQPNLIFTHSENDVNIDHRITYHATMTGIRPVNNEYLKAIYSYEVLSSTEWNYAHPFHANHFIDISEFIDLKIKAMQLYDDEMKNMPHPRSEDVIKSLATFRGCQVGVKYAEAFTLIRSIHN